MLKLERLKQKNYRIKRLKPVHIECKEYSSNNKKILTASHTHSHNKDFKGFDTYEIFISKRYKLAQKFALERVQSNFPVVNITGTEASNDLANFKRNQTKIGINVSANQSADSLQITDSVIHSLVPDFSQKKGREIRTVYIYMLKNALLNAQTIWKVIKQRFI